jgi:hypothetical protein
MNQLANIKLGIAGLGIWSLRSVQTTVNQSQFEAENLVFGL